MEPGGRGKMWSSGTCSLGGDTEGVTRAQGSSPGTAGCKPHTGCPAMGSQSKKAPPVDGLDNSWGGRGL